MESGLITDQLSQELEQQWGHISRDAYLLRCKSPIDWLNG
jgi:hypothetical protein